MKHLTIAIGVLWAVSAVAGCGGQQTKRTSYRPGSRWIAPDIDLAGRKIAILPDLDKHTRGQAREDTLELVDKLIHIFQRNRPWWRRWDSNRPAPTHWEHVSEGVGIDAKVWQGMNAPVKILERAALARAIDEQDLERLFSTAVALRAGKILAADYLLMARVIRITDKYDLPHLRPRELIVILEAAFRLVDVRTGTVVWTLQGYAEHVGVRRTMARAAASCYLRFRWRLDTDSKKL